MEKKYVLALIVAMLMGVLGASAQYKAVKPTKIKGTDITWEITADGILRFTGNGEIKIKYIHKPNGWRDPKYFPNGFHTIEIGEGITKISYGAFRYNDKEYAVGSEIIHEPQRQKINIKLPESLEVIGDQAFFNLQLSNLILPHSLKRIGDRAFHNSIHNLPELIIPSCVGEIEGDAFYGMKCDKVIIKGNTNLRGNALYGTEISLLYFEGQPIFQCYTNGSFHHNSFGSIDRQGKDKNFAKISSISFLKDFDIDSNSFQGLDNTKILMPRLQVREKVVNDSIAADKTVNGYIANRLPDWQTYSEQNKPKSSVRSAEAVKKEIEEDIAKWQVKGEFESTTEWQARVNEKTRQARIDKRMAEYKKEVEKAQSQYAEDYAKLQEQYKALRKKYSDEFYANLTAEANAEYNQDAPKLDNPYDADNETFLLTTAKHGDILLRVPRAEAPAFKSGWSEKSVAYEFVPKDESSVALTKMTFKVGGKEYVYDGKADAAYAIADVNYNFAPLAIDDINIGVSDITLPDLAMDSSSAPATVRTTGIEAKKVDVERKQIAAGFGAAPAKTVSANTAPAKAEPTPSLAEKADVDVNIPVGMGKRENTFALIIANENYRRVSQVPYALNDGEILRQYFNRTLGIPEKNILTAADASFMDIRYNLDRISDICNAFKGDASVIVYYAGHGVPAESSLDAYLLPVDGYAEKAESSGLSLDGMIKTLESLPTKQTVVFLDACFSGTGRREDMLSAARGVALKAKPTSVSNDKVILFSASQGDETAHPYDEKGHGLFTYYLLRKLGESAGEVTLGELSDYLTDRVLRQSVVNGKKQTPSVKVSAGNASWKNSKL